MILIIQNTLPHYRRPLYNALSKFEEILVVHSGEPGRNSDDTFREIILDVKSYGKIYVQRGLIEIINSEKPAVVVAMFDVRWIMSVVSMFLFDRSLNWVWWGLDKGSNRFALLLKIFLSRRNNSIIFYNDRIRATFIDYGIAKDKLYVANNTVFVESDWSPTGKENRDIFINVGSLHERKRNDVLIRVFKSLSEKSLLDIKLVFIGDGPELEQMNTLIEQYQLTGRVILIGAIDDTKELFKYYRRAIASVSYGQAGLAVLQSFGFGVPFITSISSVTGGESHNIVDGRNGLLCKDEPASLEYCMKTLLEKPEHARNLGRNALRYYRDHASMEHMVSDFLDACHYEKAVD